MITGPVAAATKSTVDNWTRPLQANPKVSRLDPASCHASPNINWPVTIRIRVKPIMNRTSQENSQTTITSGAAGASTRSLASFVLVRLATKRKAPNTAALIPLAIREVAPRGTTRVRMTLSAVARQMRTPAVNNNTWATWST